jgi:hypothetical protein
MSRGPLTNVDDFNRAVQQATRTMTQRDLVLVHKKIAQDALNLIVSKTPVDTGRARGNWQTTLHVPAAGETYAGRPNPSGGQGNAAAATQHALNSGAKVIQSIVPFCVLYLTNNVPYIRVLEFGQFDPPNPGPSSDPRKGRFGNVLVRSGYSTQAPAGMVTISIAELRRMFP